MRVLTSTLICSLAFGMVSAFANSVSYDGGTMVTFKDAKKEIKGRMVSTDINDLRFMYKENKMVSIPYANFINMEYGQKSGRRVGAAVATTILLGPLGLLTPFSKKQDHFERVEFFKTRPSLTDSVSVQTPRMLWVNTSLPLRCAKCGSRLWSRIRSR